MGGREGRVEAYGEQNKRQAEKDIHVERKEHRSM